MYLNAHERQKRVTQHAATRRTDGAENGAAIVDTAGWAELIVEYDIGASDGTLALKLEHGDASDLSDNADAPASINSVSGNLFAVTADGATGRAQACIRIDDAADLKRYVRLVATVGTSFTGVDFFTQIVLVNPRRTEAQDTVYTELPV